MGLEEVVKDFKYIKVPYEDVTLEDSFELYHINNIASECDADNQEIVMKEEEDEE